MTRLLPIDDCSQCMHLDEMFYCCEIEGKDIVETGIDSDGFSIYAIPEWCPLEKQEPQEN